MSEKPNKNRYVKRYFKRVRQASADFGNRVFHALRFGSGQIVNQREVRFVGMQRSGNHAVLNWIFSQAPEVRCFLNFIPVDANPFIYFQSKGTYKEFDQGDFLRKFNLRLERLGFHSAKSLFMYSYEDDPLDAVFSEQFERNHDRWVWKSEKRFDVLLLRDPFNLFSSRMKKESDFRENRYSLKTPEGREILVRLWKQYAREFLGETEHLSHNKVVISYNRWFSDREYRRELADHLGLEFSDATLQEVIPVGGGSSFDRSRMNQTASEMKVLERWQHYRDDSDFQTIFRDPEIIRLSDAVFGEIPGVREWIETF
jgi:hypothetical protein